jgi:hypothetical protein
MKHLRIIAGALLLAMLALAVPSFATVDNGVCTASDIGAGTCTVTTLKVNSNEELGALNNRAPLIINTITNSGNDYSGCSTPAIAAYADGQTVRVKPNFTNTGTSRFNFCGIGLVAATNSDGTAFAGGELLSTRLYTFSYFAANNQWRAMSPLGTGSSIAPNSVGNSQLAQAPASTVKCNPTGATANLQDCTLGAGLSFTGSALTASGSGGTVTSASIVSANGFAGTTATSGTTPAHTITTTVTGLVKGNGTALSAATAGTDYLSPFPSQTANSFYSAPNGAAGVPGFRAIVAADIPTLNQNTTGTAASVTGSNVVANSNLATMVNATIKCRNTAGAGSPEDCTAAQVSALTNATDAPVFANVTAKPTTVAGYGISDAVTPTTMNNNTLPASHTTLASSSTTTLGATTATSINATPLGATTASTVAATTLTASGAVTLSPASAAVAISPTGTGTVTISPVGALTINPTAASSINNTSIGATTAGSGRFSTLTSTAAATLSPANAAVTLSPTGTGNVVIAPATAGTINNMSLGATTPSTVKTTALTLTNLVNNTTAPTVTGFCTTPTVTANGNIAFAINVGTACAASTGTITLPAATNGWVCDAHNVTTPASNIVEMSSGTTTTVVLQNYARTTGVATNFTSSDVIRVKCSAY